jgi:hypothetical protein
MIMRNLVLAVLISLVAACANREQGQAILDSDHRGTKRSQEAGPLGDSTAAPVACSPIGPAQGMVPERTYGTRQGKDMSPLYSASAVADPLVSPVPPNFRAVPGGEIALPNSNDSDQKERKRIANALRPLLPEAAGVSVKDPGWTVRSEDGQLRISDFENQSLTVLLLTLDLRKFNTNAATSPIRSLVKVPRRLSEKQLPQITSCSRRRTLVGIA